MRAYLRNTRALSGVLGVIQLRALALVGGAAEAGAAEDVLREIERGNRVSSPSPGGR